MGENFVTIIFGGINAISLFLFGMYIKNTHQEQEDHIDRIEKKVEAAHISICELKNGCFERHAKIEREAGRTEMTLEAMHTRLDGMEKCN